MYACGMPGDRVRDMPRGIDCAVTCIDRHGCEGFRPQKAEDDMAVKNEKQYEALKDKGMSKERAAKIANSPNASSHGGKKSGSGGDASQGGTTAQKKKAGSKGGKTTAAKS